MYAEPLKQRQFGQLVILTLMGIQMFNYRHLFLTDFRFARVCSEITSKQVPELATLRTAFNMLSTKYRILSVVRLRSVFTALWQHRMKLVSARRSSANRWVTDSQWKFQIILAVLWVTLQWPFICARMRVATWWEYCQSNAARLQRVYNTAIIK